MLRGIAGCAPAGQHQLPSTVRGQVSGDLQAHRTQPAGHQIRCIGTQFQWYRGSAARSAGPVGERGWSARARQSGLRPLEAVLIWLISAGHSSVPAPDRSASPPHSCGYSSAATRQNPHRLVCSGDTVSVSVIRCAPRVKTQIGTRSSAAAAARNSRWVPPRTRCCIRSNDRIDGCGVGLQRGEVQDAQVRLVPHRGGQFGDQALLVGVGHRQALDPVPVTAAGRARRRVAASHRRHRR